MYMLSWLHAWCYTNMRTFFWIVEESSVMALQQIKPFHYQKQCCMKNMFPTSAQQRFNNEVHRSSVDYKTWWRPEVVMVKYVIFFVQLDQLDNIYTERRNPNSPLRDWRLSPIGMVTGDMMGWNKFRSAVKNDLPTKGPITKRSLRCAEWNEIFRMRASVFCFWNFFS